MLFLKNLKILDEYEFCEIIKESEGFPRFLKNIQKMYFLLNALKGTRYF
jgi:hypothetical protein